MIRRRVPPAEDPAETTAPSGESFECSYCMGVVEDWTPDCPRCGGLVVRVVDPPR